MPTRTSIQLLAKHTLLITLRFCFGESAWLDLVFAVCETDTVERCIRLCVCVSVCGGKASV